MSLFVCPSLPLRFCFTHFLVVVFSAFSVRLIPLFGLSYPDFFATGEELRYFLLTNFFDVLFASSPSLASLSFFCK